MSQLAWDFSCFAPAVKIMGGQHWNNHLLSYRGFIRDGNCVQHMSVIHQQECTGHPGTLFWVWSQAQQGMYRTEGTGKGKKVAQKEFQILRMKWDILVTWLRGHQVVIKSGTLLNAFCLVQEEKVDQLTPWIFLSHPSFISWANPHSVNWTVLFL